MAEDTLMRLPNEGGQVSARDGAPGLRPAHPLAQASSKKLLANLGTSSSSLLVLPGAKANNQRPVFNGRRGGDDAAPLSKFAAKERPPSARRAPSISVAQAEPAVAETGPWVRPQLPPLDGRRGAPLADGSRLETLSPALGVRGVQAADAGERGSPADGLRCTLIRLFHNLLHVLVPHADTQFHRPLFPTQP